MKKDKDLIKEKLAKRYWGQETREYDYSRSKDAKRKYILKRKTEIIKNFLKGEKGKNILDVACGTGRFFYLYGDREIHGIDISEDQLNEARRKDKKAILKVCDAEEICYPDNKFDIVITAQFLEHIPKYKKVIKEMVRVCKPGGTLITDFPNKHSLTYFPTKIRLLAGRLHYLNLFSRKKIIKLSKEFNLKILDWKYTLLITPNIFPNFLASFLEKLNTFLLKIMPKPGYLHYVKFKKK